MERYDVSLCLQLQLHPLKRESISNLCRQQLLQYRRKISSTSIDESTSLPTLRLSAVYFPASCRLLLGRRAVFIFRQQQAVCFLVEFGEGGVKKKGKGGGPGAPLFITSQILLLFFPFDMS